MQRLPLIGTLHEVLAVLICTWYCVADKLGSGLGMRPVSPSLAS